MRRAGAGLIAAVLALAGCKSTDPKPTDREATGTAASRARSKDGKDAKDGAQKWLDPVAKLPGADTSVPKGGSWGGDPKNPNFNAKAEAQDAVGGKVVDAFGRAAKNVFVRVEAVNGPPGAAAMGIYTDGGGYFFTRGLKAGLSYNLTAEATQDGKQLAGTVQTLVPNPVLTIVLRDDGGIPPGGTPKADAGTTGTFPPPPADADHIPATGLGPAPTPRTPRTDAAWSPGDGATRPVPATIGSPPGGRTPGGAIPQPDDLSIPPVGPAKPDRPENVADGPRNPFTPPAVSIPGPPTYPNPFPPPATPDPKKMGTRTGPATTFILADTLGRNWDFATSKSGSVVLVEFITTTCGPCKQAIPVLKDLQSKYGADGLQVIAVACDDLPQSQRAAAAAKYARDFNLNYSLFVEPGAAGTVRDRFDVEAYPTAFLLDGNGSVLWRGHPAKRAEIENAVKQALGRQ